jgi:ribosome-binding ATPase YchF (GTP1/OBG family)
MWGLYPYRTSFTCAGGNCRDTENIQAQMEFVDIAGLVKGACGGEIREKSRV